MPFPAYSEIETCKKSRYYSRETTLTVVKFDTLVRIDTLYQKPVSLWCKVHTLSSNRGTHWEDSAKKAEEVLYEAVKRRKTITDSQGARGKRKTVAGGPEESPN